MITPISTHTTIAAGSPTEVILVADFRLPNNIVTVTSGDTGTLAFRYRAIYGQWDTPTDISSFDLSEHSSITFNGAALEALEITYTGSGSVDVVVTQY